MGHDVLYMSDMDKTMNEMIDCAWDVQKPNDHGFRIYAEIKVLAIAEASFVEAYAKWMLDDGLIFYTDSDGDQRRAWNRVLVVLDPQPDLESAAAREGKLMWEIQELYGPVRVGDGQGGVFELPGEGESITEERARYRGIVEKMTRDFEAEAGEDPWRLIWGQVEFWVVQCVDGRGSVVQ